jgi:hypothetical protein
VHASQGAALRTDPGGRIDLPTTRLARGEPQGPLPAGGVGYARTRRPVP